MDRHALVRRRDLLQYAAIAGALTTIPGGLLMAQSSMLKRPIPGKDESLPVIGLGTYEVFDVAGSEEEIAARRSIVDALFDAGGSVIDSSPMYNRSEAVVGRVLGSGGTDREAFLATKVWTNGRAAGERQMRRSAELMGTDSIDLMQVHNRRDLAAHWPAIQEMKASGFIRYDGITDYRDSAHDAMMQLMREYRPDFIQINFSLGERAAEDRLLPLAADLGIAVLVNRPFVAGRLFRAVGDRPVPEWAQEFAGSWGQFFLKYIVSQPAVTCAIPATSRLRHMIDNAGAGHGVLPDADQRRRMVQLIEQL